LNSIVPVIKQSGKRGVEVHGREYSDTDMQVEENINERILEFEASFESLYSSRVID
jgi:hypothetical protein